MGEAPDRLALAAVERLDRSDVGIALREQGAAESVKRDGESGRAGGAQRRRGDEWASYGTAEEARPTLRVFENAVVAWRGRLGAVAGRGGGASKSTPLDRASARRLRLGALKPSGRAPVADAVPGLRCHVAETPSAVRVTTGPCCTCLGESPSGDRDPHEGLPASRDCVADAKCGVLARSLCAGTGRVGGVASRRAWLSDVCPGMAPCGMCDQRTESHVAREARAASGEAKGRTGEEEAGHA